MKVENINFKKGAGFVPAVIQHYQSGKVLMVGMMNEQALLETQKSGKVTFFSRTKNRLWQKGETSGNFLLLKSVSEDCDNDALLIKVEPAGAVCHTGAESCFNDQASALGESLFELQTVIDQRRAEGDEKSYVRSLSQAGIAKIAQKVGEEATEVVIAALVQDREQLIAESADLLFHLLVLLRAKEIGISEVLRCLQDRRKNTENSRL
jgi:phosphoribosyl-ATP pyrophosphohydrolase/phosphoribosyl-AMP cyclohydrolase